MLSIKPSSKIFRFLAALMVMILTGCVMQPPPQDIHTRLQKQSIAYVPLAPKVLVNLDITAKSRPKGAVKGGVWGALELFGKTGGACVGPPEICGFVILSSLALGFIVGGIIGAVVATPAERTEEMEAAIDKGVSSIALQLGLPEKILAEAERYDWIKLDLSLTSITDKSPEEVSALWRSLGQDNYGFALQTQITHFEFVGGEGYDPELMFRLGVKTTLVDLENLETVFEETFFHVSPKKRFSVWASGDSRMIRDLLERNVTDLAQEIVDKLFLQTDLPLSSGMWSLPGTKKYGCCWLCPISPPYEVDYWPKVQLLYSVVESLTPLLEWEALNDDIVQKALGVTATEGKVTYDLRIWDSFNDTKHDLVYEQTFLDEPKHQVKKPLSSQRRYFWSFRACISRQGFKSCTPWASSVIPSPAPALVKFDYCGSAVIQDWNYYRFETP